MPTVTATDASGRLADLLDAVERRGERYAIVRCGRVVAQLVPATAPTGADVKAMLRRHRPDTAWSDELAELRSSLLMEERRGGVADLPDHPHDMR